MKKLRCCFSKIPVIKTLKELNFLRRAEQLASRDNVINGDVTTLRCFCPSWTQRVASTRRVFYEVSTTYRRSQWQFNFSRTTFPTELLLLPPTSCGCVLLRDSSSENSGNWSFWFRGKTLVIGNFLSRKSSSNCGNFFFSFSSDVCIIPRCYAVTSS